MSTSADSNDNAIDGAIDSANDVANEESNVVDEFVDDVADDDWDREFDPRSDARERALNVLFEADVRACPPAEVVARIRVPLDDLTTMLVEGVADRAAEIDSILTAHSHAWTIERMATTDRNVLRIGTFELLARLDVPKAVVIDEAVDLAKRYGTDESGRFVNGVLSAVARTVRDGASPSGTGSTTD
jgi:N utilization substance protein B